VPFRKRRSLIRVRRESVNSNRPEFLPTVRYRQSIRQRSRLTISNRKAPLSAGLLFNSRIAAPYHLPLHLSPSDGLHINRSSTCIRQYKIVVCRRYTMYRLLRGVSVPTNRQRKNRANSGKNWELGTMVVVVTRGCRVEVSRQQAAAASAEKNMLGFRARASRISSLASGRILLSSCGAEPSRAQTGCRPLRGGPWLWLLRPHWTCQITEIPVRLNGLRTRARSSTPPPPQPQPPCLHVSMCPGQMCSCLLSVSFSFHSRTS
jgi:hypothetical protein